MSRLWERVSDKGLFAAIQTAREVIQRAAQDITLATRQLAELEAEARLRWGDK